MAAGKLDEDRRKQIESDCVSEAWKTGATSAVTALGLAGAAVGGANYFFQGFRTSLGVSGKAALVVSPTHPRILSACMRSRGHMRTHTFPLDAGISSICNVLAIFRACPARVFAEETV